MPASDQLQSRVVDIVADALCVDRAEVTMHASLVDDLGAESIDFLDLQFRIESAFGLKIADDEIWRGAIDPRDADDPAAIARAVAQLRERTPDFRWETLPTPVTKADLPRLITVRTIVDYLRGRVAPNASAAGD